MANNNPNLHLVNINAHTILVKFYQSERKILGEILTAVKGHDSVTIFWKIMCSKPNLDIVYIHECGSEKKGP